MKKLLLLLMAVSVLSCSDDDDSAPAPKPMLTTAEFNSLTDEARTYTLTYDDRRNISSIVRTGDQPATYNFSYHPDDRINTIVANVTGEAPETITFLYDQEQFTGYSAGGVQYDLQYDQNSGIYTLNGTQFSYNEWQDFATYASLQHNYDESLNGPMTNARGNPMILAVVLDGYFRFFGAKKPIESRYDAETNTTDTFENTFNDKGYLTEFILYTGGSVVALGATFEYTDM